MLPDELKDHAVAAALANPRRKLKRLVLTERATEPLDKKLADFPFKIDGQNSLALFLDQMRGSKVELKYGAETISGTVVSGRVVKADDKQPEREQLVALLDSGELRMLDLAAASSIRFADPKLQVQLRDYLAVVNQSRSTD